MWGLLLLLSVLNGGLRERWLFPALGPLHAHQVSTLLLSALSWGANRGALTIGALGLGLTLAFEFLAGHFPFHKPWPVLLADHDLSRGRIWILVPW